MLRAMLGSGGSGESGPAVGCGCLIWGAAVGAILADVDSLESLFWSVLLQDYLEDSLALEDWSLWIIYWTSKLSTGASGRSLEPLDN